MSDALGPEADTIYHAALPDDWAQAKVTGSYRVSTRGMSLDEVGFIHASFADQVAAVANRYYADVDELVLLVIDTKCLGAPVVVEAPAPGSEERYPHIYGPVLIDAVIATRTWRRPKDGDWHAPPIDG